LPDETLAINHQLPDPGIAMVQDAWRQDPARHDSQRRRLYHQAVTKNSEKALHSTHQNSALHAERYARKRGLWDLMVFMLRKPMSHQTALEMVTLGSLVPSDYFLRKIDAVIDFPS
jgi:hypothetical protein